MAKCYHVASSSSLGSYGLNFNDFRPESFKINIIHLMHIRARNKYIAKVSMVKNLQINAYLAKKSPDPQTKAKIPRYREKSPAVLTLAAAPDRLVLVAGVATVGRPVFSLIVFK